MAWSLLAVAIVAELVDALIVGGLGGALTVRVAGGRRRWWQATLYLARD
jgi:hypothetical protein